MLFVVSRVSYLKSQSSINSPYSRYGIGDLQNSGFARNAGMGGLGIAFQNDTLSPFFINNQNPASYASMRLTVFEAGVLSNTYNTQSASDKQTKNSTSLGYIGFGIPIKKWWGTSFGLMPYSNVGYKISDQQTLDSIGKVDYLYQGSGGINKIYFGNALKLKNLSVGANASYLFGTINYMKQAVFSNTGYLNTRINKSISVNDLYLDYGLQYTIKIDSLRKKILVKTESGTKVSRVKKDIDDVKITFGATLVMQSDINAKSNTLAQTCLVIFGYETIKDTNQNTVDQKGSLSLPLCFGAGLTVKKGNRWMIAADYLAQKWSGYSVFGYNPGLKNSTKITLGGKYVSAKVGSIQSGYWKRVQYLAGLKYYQTYLELYNTQLSEYALSLGIGLPVGRQKVRDYYSIVNLSVELGQRGTISNNLIKEQFARITLGFTVNDRWFIPRRID